ncbi:C-5 sterol desaturase [Saccharomycopsis crataegensis]|uniref:C-5 sterol desaturase n=1 Tax=Saccharomycopsis crataegensis TaxID=43959 RepID=A0AAV5QJU5_9ASCO|nr:C-5 sterol desaturase [Saccharomycopsis crataegensis]
MDIVLEFADYFFFDKVYATLFPTTLAQHLPAAVSKNLRLGNYSSKALDFANSLSYVPSQFSNNDELYELTKKYIVEKDIYGYFPHFLPESVDMYSSVFPRHHFFREALSLWIIGTIFGWILYLLAASFSYRFIFDKAVFNHPRYLKNQMSLEIRHAMGSIPVMVFLTLPCWLAELSGYSKLYLGINESTGGWTSVLLQYPLFVMFTDFGIYCIHRWLHWPNVYKLFHKPHHKWIVTTPYASHAFHPFDGYAQSLPYHIYPILFPLHKVSYLILFTFVNFWTVMIHDGEYLTDDPVVNGAACHTVHHLYFNYNYGQFTTLWDRIGGTYRKPDQSLFDKSKKKEKQTWELQVEQYEKIRNVVEGNNDFRVYGTEENLVKRK